MIDIFFFMFALLSTTVNIGSGIRTIKPNEKELSLPYKNVSATNSYNGEHVSLEYEPRPHYRRKIKKSKRQLVTIEGSGFDLALQAPDLNQTQVEFEFPDNKRNFTVEIVEISHKSESDEDNKPPQYSSAPKRRKKVSRPLYPLESQSVTTSKPRPVYNKLKPRLRPVAFNIDIPPTGPNLDVRGDSIRSNSIRHPKISSSVRSINEIIEKPKTFRGKPKPTVVIDDPSGLPFEATRNPTRFKSTTSTTETPQVLIDATRRPFYGTRSPVLIFYDDDKDINMDDLKSYLQGYSQFGSKESMTPPPSIYGDYYEDTKIPQVAIVREGETQLPHQSSQEAAVAATERTMSIALSGYLPNYQPNPTPPQISEDTHHYNTKRSTTIPSVEKRKRTLETIEEPQESEEVNDSITKGSSSPTRSQNYYTHAQVVPLTKTPAEIEREKQIQKENKELEENSNAFNHQDAIIISPNVRYAPNVNPPFQKSTKHNSKYEKDDNYSPRVGKYDSPSRKYDSPSGQYDSSKGKYDSPSGKYDSPSGKYDSPFPSGKYDSPSRKYDPSSVKYNAPSIKYSPREVKLKEDDEDPIAARMARLYREGHPGILPAPKDAQQRPYKQPPPIRSTVDEEFRNPYPHDPLQDEPPLKFDPESDRFYGEPVPDKKEGQSNRYEVPLDRRLQNNPEKGGGDDNKSSERKYEDRPRERDYEDQPRERDYEDQPREKDYDDPPREREYADRPRDNKERKKDDYDESRGRGYRDNYFDIPVTAYPLTADERRSGPETHPKGYIQDFVSLDNNFEELPKVRESDFGSLLPKLSDDEFRPYEEQDRYRDLQPARASSSSTSPREGYDYDEDSNAYNRDRNRDRERYATVREPEPETDTRENDHYAENEGSRELPQDFSDGYANAGRGFGFDAGQSPAENLPLDPIYTRTLKQFDEEIALLQRNEGKSKDYPPPVSNTRYRDNPAPIEPHNSRDESRSHQAPKYNEQVAPVVKEESAEEQYPASNVKNKEEPEEEEEEEEAEEEEPEGDRRETEAEPEVDQNEKKHEETRMRDTLSDGKDKRPPPDKPQTEKSGSIDEDIVGIEKEWGRVRGG